MKSRKRSTKQLRSTHDKTSLVDREQSVRASTHSKCLQTHHRSEELSERGKFVPLHRTTPTATRCSWLSAVCSGRVCRRRSSSMVSWRTARERRTRRLRRWRVRFLARRSCQVAHHEARGQAAANTKHNRMELPKRS